MWMGCFIVFLGDDFGGVIVLWVVELVSMLLIEFFVFFEFMNEVLSAFADACKTVWSPEPFFIAKEASSSAFVIDFAVSTWCINMYGSMILYGTQVIPCEIWCNGAGKDVSIGCDGE